MKDKKSAPLWRLESHCCRACFGRIMSRPSDDEDGDTVYRCSNCGIEVEGTKPSVMCACGTKIRKGGKQSATFVDAGLRCHVNQHQTPSLPSEIVASYGGAQSE